MLSAPVDALGDFRLLVQCDILEDVLLEYLKTRPVHDVADVLLVFHRIRVNVLLDVGVGVRGDLQNALLITPLDEILRQTRVLLSGPSQDHQT